MPLRKDTLVNKDRSQPECWDPLGLREIRRMSHNKLRFTIMNLVRHEFNGKLSQDAKIRALRENNLIMLRVELDKRIAKGHITL